MNGIVLWYKYDKKIGLVWCDDQGPLACITSETVVNSGFEGLEAGDQIVVETRDAGGMREVRQVLSRRPSSTSLDIQTLLTAEAQISRSVAAEGADQPSQETKAEAQATDVQADESKTCKDVANPSGHLRVVA